MTKANYVKNKKLPNQINPGSSQIRGKNANNISIGKEFSKHNDYERGQYSQCQTITIFQWPKTFA